MFCVIFKMPSNLIGSQDEKLKFQVFEDIIKEIMIVYKHDSRPWLIGYSGGKDSTLLVSLVYEAMKRLKDAGAKLDKTVHVITSDTMVENPIVKNYMHSSSDNINRAAGKDRLNIKASVIYPEPEQTFWSRVIGLGYPTPEPPGFRWCTDRLKIMPMNKFVNERIKESGEIIILLGVRKGESLTRMKTITAREIEGKLLNMHNDIPNAYVYNPITEIPNDLVWEFLLKGDCRSPWGSDMKYLFSLYQGENLGEEKSVLGEVDREKIPVTGNSRFGCWCCTMVKEDKSLQNFINKGATELIPLREFRNELLRMRENSQYRDSKRRNGSVYKKSDGSFGMGPFTLEARCLILEKLLDLENRTGMELITEAELKAIDKMWDEEGDLTCRALVETYHKVKGKKLPWDDYKTPRFDDEAIQAIRDVADKFIQFDVYYCCALIGMAAGQIDEDTSELKDLVERYPVQYRDCKAQIAGLLVASEARRLGIDTQSPKLEQIMLQYISNNDTLLSEDGIKTLNAYALKGYRLITDYPLFDKPTSREEFLDAFNVAMQFYEKKDS